MVNLKKIIFSILILAVCFSCKKEGCTDSEALNYNPKAKTNNSLCKYATDEQTGNTQEEFPVLIEGNLNFIDDDTLVNFKGITSYHTIEDSVYPNVFGYISPNGTSFLLELTHYEDEEKVYDLGVFTESFYSSPLYGNYDVEYLNPYIGFNVVIIGKVHEDNFTASFPTTNYQNYYKNLDTPINNSDINGLFSINLSEPNLEEELTSLSGNIEATLYYDEEIVENENQEEVRIYNKKLIIELSIIDGKLE